MRVTIGHVLILGAFGAGVAFSGPIKSLNLEWATSKAHSVKDGLGSIVSVIRPKSQAVPEAPPAPQQPYTSDLPVREAMPVPESPLAPSTSAATANAAAPAAVVAPAAPPASVVKGTAVKKPLRKKRVARKRARSAKKVTAAKKPAASSAARASAKKGSGNVDRLVGTYVALKLKNGNEVKGILESKSASAYLIQLPGLGPFEYSFDSVIDVRPAE